MGFFSMLGNGLLAIGRGFTKSSIEIQSDLASYGMSSIGDIKKCRNVRLLRTIQKNAKSYIVQSACVKQIKQLSK